MGRSARALRAAVVGRGEIGEGQRGGGLGDHQGPGGAALIVRVVEGRDDFVRARRGRGAGAAGVAQLDIEARGIGRSARALRTAVVGHGEVGEGQRGGGFRDGERAVDIGGRGAGRVARLRGTDDDLAGTGDHDLIAADRRGAGDDREGDREARARGGGESEGRVAETAVGQRGEVDALRDACDHQDPGGGALVEIVGDDGGDLVAADLVGRGLRAVVAEVDGQAGGVGDDRGGLGGSVVGVAEVGERHGGGSLGDGEGLFDGGGGEEVDVAALRGADDDLADAGEQQRIATDRGRAADDAVGDGQAGAGGRGERDRGAAVDPVGDGVESEGLRAARGGRAVADLDIGELRGGVRVVDVFATEAEAGGGEGRTVAGGRALRAAQDAVVVRRVVRVGEGHHLGVGRGVDGIEGDIDAGGGAGDGFGEAEGDAVLGGIRSREAALRSAEGGTGDRGGVGSGASAFVEGGGGTGHATVAEPVGGHGSGGRGEGSRVAEETEAEPEAAVLGGPGIAVHLDRDGAGEFQAVPHPGQLDRREEGVGGAGEAVVRVVLVPQRAGRVRGVQRGGGGEPTGEVGGVAAVADDQRGGGGAGVVGVVDHRGHRVAAGGERSRGRAVVGDIHRQAGGLGGDKDRLGQAVVGDVEAVERQDRGGLGDGETPLHRSGGQVVGIAGLGGEDDDRARAVEGERVADQRGRAADDAEDDGQGGAGGEGEGGVAEDAAGQRGEADRLRGLGDDQGAGGGALVGGIVESGDDGVAAGGAGRGGATVVGDGRRKRWRTGGDGDGFRAAVVGRIEGTEAEGGGGLGDGEALLGVRRGEEGEVAGLRGADRDGAESGDGQAVAGEGGGPADDLVGNRQAGAGGGG